MQGGEAEMVKREARDQRISKHGGLRKEREKRAGLSTRGLNGWNKRVPSGGLKDSIVLDSY